MMKTWVLTKRRNSEDEIIRSGGMVAMTMCSHSVAGGLQGLRLLRELLHTAAGRDARGGL